MPSSSIQFGKAMRGVYEAPKLTVYGDARTLTASGTRGLQEGGTSPACSNNPNRRPC